MKIILGILCITQGLGWAITFHWLNAIEVRIMRLHNLMRYRKP